MLVDLSKWLSINRDSAARSGNNRGELSAHERTAWQHRLRSGQSGRCIFYDADGYELGFAHSFNYRHNMLLTFRVFSPIH
jgi:hypothetical protein